MSNILQPHPEDLHHLKLIRESVDKHLETANRLIWKDDIVLEIAPQSDGGLSSFKRPIILETLNIIPGCTYHADLCNNNSHIIPDERFNTIICTEVLEHVRDPFAAARELRRMVKQGGRVFVTTPLNFRIHGPLPDCWRFTEHGLRILFQDFTRLEIEEVKSYRNLFPIHYRLILIK